MGLTVAQEGGLQQVRASGPSDGMAFVFELLFGFPMGPKDPIVRHSALRIFVM